MATYNSYNLKNFMAGLVRRNPQEPEFHQSVHEVAETVIPYIRRNPQLADGIILERMTEPERIFTFRVIWEDDRGNIRVNRGYRVQFNNALGPYKGGLRFHPSVNLSILKFLAFEQTFKNALTTLPLGAAKGGADFNPQGKSNREVLRFCKSFMLELFKYIGPNVDVPAGDIGVGEREIGYLFGQYKRITGEFASGVLTGKGLDFGGSRIRREATGYGAAIFAQAMLNQHKQDLSGQRCLVSGSGNVAQYCAEKITQLGGRVLTMSDSGGFIYDKDGIDEEKLRHIMEIKNARRARISEYVKTYRRATYHAGARPWGVAADMAFPCATQNEIDRADAEALVANGAVGVVEGANMPTTAEALAILRSRVLFAPAKAANAGGVAISGLEMSQNSLRLSWSESEMQERLAEIMHSIHSQCAQFGGGSSGGSGGGSGAGGGRRKSRRQARVDYITGANLAGFIRVAAAMQAHGV